MDVLCIQQKILELGRRYGRFLEKVSEKFENWKYSEMRPFNSQFQKFQEENQMERKFPYEIFETETRVNLVSFPPFQKF